MRTCCSSPAPATAPPPTSPTMYLDGTLEEHYSEYTRDREGLFRFVPAFSFPGGLPEPPDAVRSRDDPRGRRARRRACDRLRRRARQPRADRRLHRRRRRGRDRADGGCLARHEVPRPGDVRRGAADPARERLQDLVADRLRDDERRRAVRALPGPRLGAALRGRAGLRRRARRRDGRGLRADRRGDALRPAASTLADDRAALPEGARRPEARRRPSRGGLLPLAPGTGEGVAHEPEAPGGGRGLAALVPAGGALRRRGPAGARPRWGVPVGRPPTRTEPACTRREAAPPARPAAPRRLRAAARGARGGPS